jgi:hypothetical protein
VAIHRIDAHTRDGAQHVGDEVRIASIDIGGCNEMPDAPRTTLVECPEPARGPDTTALDYHGSQLLAGRFHVHGDVCDDALSHGDGHRLRLKPDPARDQQLVARGHAAHAKRTIGSRLRPPHHPGDGDLRGANAPARRVGDEPDNSPGLEGRGLRARTRGQHEQRGQEREGNHWS